MCDLRQSHASQEVILLFGDVGTRSGLFVSPPYSHLENLTPKVTVLGSGTFGRWFGHENRALLNGISARIKETPMSSLPCPPLSEDTARSQQSATQKNLTTRILDFQPQEL